MQETNNNPQLKDNQKDFENRAEQIIRPMLEKQKAIGIRIGLLAASKAVMERLNDTSKPLLKRIESVKKFCNVAMRDEKGFLNDEPNNNEKSAEISAEESSIAEVTEDE